MKIKQEVDFLADHYSYSKLSCISSCLYKAFLRYVRREKGPTPEFFVRGSAVHAGQEHDNNERILGRSPSLLNILDVAAVRYKREGRPEDLDGFVDEHAVQLQRYWETGLRSRLVPIKDKIECAWEIDLAVSADPAKTPPRPAVLSGFIDVVVTDEGGQERVIDYKTAGRAVSDTSLGSDLQGPLYALGAEVPRFQYLTFVKAGERAKPNFRASRLVEVGRSAIEYVLRFALHGITAFRSALKTGDFPRTDPNSWQCSCCEFRGHCFPEEQADFHKFISIGEVRPAGTLPKPTWRK